MWQLRRRCSQVHSPSVQACCSAGFPLQLARLENDHSPPTRRLLGEMRCQCQDFFRCPRNPLPSPSPVACSRLPMRIVDFFPLTAAGGGGGRGGGKWCGEGAHKEGFLLCMCGVRAARPYYVLYLVKGCTCSGSSTVVGDDGLLAGWLAG